MKRRWAALAWRSVGLVAVLGLACASPVMPTPARSPGACVLQGTPELIAQDDVAIHQLWELPDSSVLWLDAHPDSAALRHYEEVARARTNVDPLVTLKRQYAVSAAPGKSEGMHREAENMLQVLDGKVGQIERANCLVRLLFAAQAERFSLIENPTEFGAFVLRKGAAPTARIRIYYSGMNRLGGRISREVLARVEADSQQGWEVLAHLHNHSFLFDRKVGDKMWTTQESQEDIGGGISPSRNDVSFYLSSRAELKLRGVWVSNGFDTLHLRSEELDRLRPAD